MLQRRYLTVPPAVLILSSAHLVNDIFGNIYAPLLPLFIPKLGLSLTAAGTIAASIQIAGSIAQLVFGPLADRWRPKVLAVAGPLVAVTFMSLAGLATSPLMLGSILVIGCLGSAAFHPTAAAIVNRAGGDRRGTAMSVHVTGGAMGNAIAPLIFAPFVQHFGLDWTPVLAIPAVVLLVSFLHRIPDVRLTHGNAPAGFGALRPYALPLALLWTAVVVRTMVALGFSTFLPVLMTGRGLSVSQAGLAVALYLGAGSFGGLAGGPIADRFGPRRVIAWSLFLAVPLLALALIIPGPAAMVVLTAGGFFLGSTLPVNITYAHAIAPVATGTVSSLMLGVAWGVGGLAVPLVGMLGDTIGLQPALGMLAFLPAIAALLTLRLPERASHAL
ncbi:MAG TPA: MFS transporter [Vicinamibacterales bacterium]|jgi:FSR family fosmidomycin resistance protein-like MFS transporter